MQSPIPDPLLAAFDEVVSDWPDVRAKGVFGHRGYVRAGKMFAFLAEPGVSVKISSEKDQDAAYARPDVEPFAHSGMPMRQWPVFPLTSPDDLDALLDRARASYESVA